MKQKMSARWVIASFMALLAVSTLAFAQGNQVSQSISMDGEGGYVSQNGANVAVVVGSNNQLNQDISQNAQGNYITQSGANAAAIVGNNNVVDQGVHQDASGNHIAQSGANAIAVVGDDNYVSQEVDQQAYGDEIYQTGWNSGNVYGDGNTLIQRTFAYARTNPIRVADPVQTMSNSAYIMGSYNSVAQDIAAYGIVDGRGNGPVNQSAKNRIETPEMAWNNFHQGIAFMGRSGPGSEIMQTAHNELRIGPV